MSANNNLKIALFGPLPPPYGGMANQLNQLAKLLTQEGVQIEIVQTNFPYPDSWLGKIKGIRAIVRFIQYLPKIWLSVKRVQVLHVFANSGWSWQLFSAPVLWIARIRRVPVIVNYRGGEAKQYFSNSIRFVRPSMNLATRIIVPSTYLQEIFNQFAFKADVIPNIIDLERFKPSSHDFSYHIVITRNLEAIYGISTAIHALKIVKKNWSEVKMSIAGSGDQEQYLIHLTKELGLEQNISFTGKLPPDEIIKLYQQADVMLNPTQVDNMPNSLLEAMACGLPIISTDAGGVPYLVENYKTALLTQVDNVEMMAEKIDELFKDHVLREKLRCNGLQAIQQYAWPNVKVKWLSLYQKLG